MKTTIILACALFLLHTVHGQMTAAYNKPAEVMTRTVIPAAPSLLGVFEGRSPCQEIAKQLNVPKDPGCIKLKWRLMLYHDPSTRQPTTYKMEGSFSRETPRTGKWTILKGMPGNPDATIYQLDPDKPQQSFYFYKGDDNILFILDEHKNFRVGNADFSYTLNRVKLVPVKE
jgi:hypothetical protein